LFFIVCSREWAFKSTCRVLKREKAILVL